MSETPTRRQLITFLNSLPTTTDAGAWLNEFDRALRALFSEIDHIAISYNLLDEKHRDSRLNWADMNIDADQSMSLGFGSLPEPV